MENKSVRILKQLGPTLLFGFLIFWIERMSSKDKDQRLINYYFRKYAKKKEEFLETLQAPPVGRNITIALPPLSDLYDSLYDKTFHHLAEDLAIIDPSLSNILLEADRLLREAHSVNQIYWNKIYSENSSPLTLEEVDRYQKHFFTTTNTYIEYLNKSILEGKMPKKHYEITQKEGTN